MSWYDNLATSHWNSINGSRAGVLKALSGVLKGRSLCKCGHFMAMHGQMVGCLAREGDRYCQCAKNQEPGAFKISHSPLAEESPRIPETTQVTQGTSVTTVTSPNLCACGHPFDSHA